MKRGARGGKAGTRTLSRSSLHRWRAAAAQGVAVLAPATKGTEVPPWAAHLLALWQQPQKPCLSWAVEQLQKTLPEAPSYDTARRFLKHVGTVSQAAGRMGPRDLKSIRPFVRRDSSHMEPGDCYTADGHTYDAEVAHPFHGRPFRPEVTSVLDIATKKAVGWSVGLAESTLTSLDALRHAVTTHGRNALYYVDHGCGFDNQAMTKEGVGFMARRGLRSRRYCSTASSTVCLVRLFFSSKVAMGRPLMNRPRSSARRVSSTLYASWRVIEKRFSACSFWALALPGVGVP